MNRAIKLAAAFVFWRWPFGDVFKADDGEGGTLRVTKNLWVITSDGRSSDALPLNFCSQELVDRVVASIQKRWWYLPPDAAPSAAAVQPDAGDKP